MSINIDLTKFSTKELIELNEKIVCLLKMKSQTECLSKLTKFKVGEMVFFHSNEGALIEGVIVRINQKSLSISTEEHGKWRISPQLVQKKNTGEVKTLKIVKH